MQSLTLVTSNMLLVLSLSGNKGTGKACSAVFGVAPYGQCLKDGFLLFVIHQYEDRDVYFEWL